MVETVAEANSLKQSDCLLLALFIVVLAKENHRQFDILKGAHRGEQIECLEYKTDVLESKLGQEIISALLINFLAHDEELT